MSVNKLLCVTNTSDKIFCANTNLDTKPQWNQLPGLLTQVVAYKPTVLYGVNSNNDIFAGDLNMQTPNVNWVNVNPTKLTNISVGTKTACGINPSKQAVCIMQGSATAVPVKDNMKQILVAPNDSGYIGITTDDQVVFGDQASGAWVNSAYSLKQISVDFNTNQVCGTNKNDDVFCSIGNGQIMKQIPGKLSSVSVRNGKLYGIQSNGDLYYGKDITNPQWKGIGSGYKSVSYNEFLN
jgi:hypothetical protein